jgi:hypothetical protein
MRLIDCWTFPDPWAGTPRLHDLAASRRKAGIIRIAVITNQPWPPAWSVLVRQQAQHASSSRLSVGEQASADFAHVTLLNFNPLPNFLGLLLASGQVLLDFAAMTQVVGNDGVHVGQRQRGVSLHDRLGGRAILERPNDQLQQDARIADAYSSGGIFSKRGRFGLSGESHGECSRLIREPLSAILRPVLPVVHSLTLIVASHYEPLNATHTAIEVG